jgi:guanylate kinase
MMSGLLGDTKKGLLFILSAPAGTGKTTLVKLLTEEFQQVIASISFTTRLPRGEEKHGKDYHFVTRNEFEEKINASDFLEYVMLYDTYYGTSRQWVEEQRLQGKHVFLVIDTQGALQLKDKLDAILIFIRPPSMEVLRTRLLNRKTESAEMVEKRLEWAGKELEFANQYDYQVVNDNLKEAYQVLRSIVIAECHRVQPPSV